LVDGELAVSTLKAANNHASLLATEGAMSVRKELEQALILLDDVVARAPSVHGELDPATLTYRLHRAKILSNLGRHTSAIAEFRRVLAIIGDVLPPDHPTSLNSRRHFGIALLEAGSLAEGLAVLGGAAAELEAALGRSHPLWPAARLDEARALALIGRADDAEAALLEALESGVNPARVKGEPAFAALMESREVRGALARMREASER
jgi:tetratricopeptide (TPR) repeat protein